MKKLTIRFIILSFAVVTLTVTSVYAQKLVRFKKGNATVRATIGGKKKSVTWHVSGKQFKKLLINQKSSEKFRYEIRRGSEFLSSGHTTSIETIESDGKSTYSITIINDEDKARRVVLSFQQTGGGSKKV